MQLNYNESLGAPKVPKVKWSDVGGLDNVKEEIIKTVKLPLKYPELVKMSGLKRSGN
jgi:peroxin-6